MHKLAGQMGQEQRGWMPCKHEGSAHVHLYALEREDEPAVAVGHLPLPLLRSLSSPPSFEAPGIFPGSLLQPVGAAADGQRQRGRHQRETRLCSDPLFFSSPFLQGPRRGIAEVGLLGGSEGVPDLVLPLHTD